MVLRGLKPHVAHLHKEPGFPREPGMKAPWLSRILTAKAYATLYRCIDKVNMRVVTPSELDPATRASLVERFKPEVQRLSDLLDRDLVRLWHYD